MAMDYSSAELTTLEKSQRQISAINHCFGLQQTRLGSLKTVLRLVKKQS